MNTILLAVGLLSTAFNSNEPAKQITKETPEFQCTITIQKVVDLEYECPGGQILDYSATGQCTVTAESCVAADVQATSCATGKVMSRLQDKLDITVGQCD